MELSQKQKDLLCRRNLVVLATADEERQPRIIIVEVNKTEKNELIITSNQMVISEKNILANKKVSVLAYEDDYSYGIRITGEAKYLSSGEDFEYVKSLETNKNYSPKAAVVITINTIEEFA
jgi:pyridoxine/pyridoxamine 5'-phosphate oxidase